MNKVIKQGLQITASLDPSSQKAMRAALHSVFNESANIDFNTPENMKAIQAFASLFRDVFAQVGKKDFDFSKIIQLPGPEIFKELTASVNEFESAWSSVASRLGDGGLKNIFMRDQSELSMALERMTNTQGNLIKRRVDEIQKAFKQVNSKDLNYLMEEAKGTKTDFINSETWEQQSAAALRYLNIRERIMKLTNGDIGEAIEKGMRTNYKDTFEDLGNLGAYTVQQLESAKPQIQASLQNIFNLANGKSLIGLTGGGAINFDVAPRVIKTLDVGDVLGGKKSIEIPVNAVFKSNLDELRELYAKSETDDAAFEQFERLQNKMVQSLPNDMQEQAMDRLLKFAELTKVTAKNYNAIWKDFIGYGLPIGTGTGSGAGGAGTGTGDGVGTAPEEVSEQNQLVQQYNANKEKTLALLKKEQLSYEEILYLVKEVQTEYAKAFYDNKNWDLGDDVNSLMTSVYGKLRRGDMIDPRLDKAINGVGMSAEDGAKILADYQNKQLEIIQTQEKLNNVESQNPQTQDAIKQEAVSYDELKQKVEAFCRVRQQMYSLMESGKPWQHLMPDVNAAKNDLASLFPEKGDETTITSKWTRIYLGETLDNEETMLNRLAKDLGIEIPQAANVAKGAIDGVVGTQEKLNGVENQNPPAQDDTGVHNANADAIKKEIEAMKQLQIERMAQGNITDLYWAVKHPDLHKGELEAALQSNPNLISELTTKRDELQAKLQPIQEMANKISQMSSIKDIPFDQLRQEAINVGQQLSTMYDQGITDTEEYIALQYKLINIIDKIGVSYGGVKSSGAKDTSELRRWVRNSIESEFGKDPMDEKVVEALWGQGEYSIMKTNAQTFNQRDMAAKLLGQGSELLTFEFKDLSKFNLVIEALSKIPQSANTAKQSVDGLNDSLEKKNAIENTDNDGAETADENAKTEAIKQQNAALQENITLKGQANGQGVGTGMGGAGTTPAPTQIVPDGATSAEAGELEAVRAKVLEVTNAVNTKTQAFFAEQKAVKSIARSEVHALGEVEKKVTAVRVALNNLQTKQHKIDLSVAGGEDISNITSTEMDALTKLRAALQLVTKRVDEKTQAFETEKSVVTKVVGSEINALNKLNTQVGAVNTTIMNLLANIQTAQVGVANIVVPQAQPVVQNTNAQKQGSSGGSATSPQLFNARVDTQFSSLSLMYAQLESVGKLTPQIEQQWLQLWDSLSKVNDTSSLQLWREELAQVRNAMKEIIIANDLVEKEGTQSFQQLIGVTKLYNQMLIGATKAKTPESRGAYEQEANAALAEQIMLLKNITLTKEQQAQFDELEIERARQINLIKAQQTGREKQIQNAQVEAEIVKQLVVLYEQLGRVQALGDTTGASAIRQQIGAERAKLSSVDYATDMKFMHAKDKGYNAEQTKANNAALKEQENILKRLNKMYQEYGMLVERAGATAGTNFGAEIADQAAAKEAEIMALRQSLNIITPEMADGFDAAFDKGKSIESRKQYEAIAKKSDQDEISRLKTIEGLEKEIGSLRAKVDNATNDGVKTALEQEIQLRKDLIALQEQGLAMDAQDEAYYRQMYASKTKQAEGYAKESQKSAASAFNEEIKRAQREAGLSKSTNVANKAVDILVNAGQIQGISPEQQANLDAYRGKIEALRNTIDSFPKDGIATEAQKQQLIAQRLEVDNYTREIQELMANYERLSGPNAQSLNATTQLGLGASAEAYQKELTEAVQSFHRGKASIKGYDAETKTLTYTLKTGKGEFTQYAASVRQTDGALMTVRGTTTKTMGVFESIGQKIKQYSYYFTGSMMFMRVFSELKKGVSIVKEIDSALTELKKVTDETEETYDKFLDTAAKTAGKIGSTVKDVVSSTADFARLGYAMEEATQMATSAQVLMNVSEFDDISRATDTLISSIQAFKYTAEESMDVVDILNTIGNNYAISTADLATSLTKSSGSLVAANGTLQEAVALTATANTIIQDADVVGTALKTVAMRLRGTDTKTMEEEGLDTDGAIESKSKLQSKIEGLSGVNILTDTGAYKSTYQILSEIADVWGDINDMDQAALLEVLAGKRAGSVMSAILQNPETLKNAFESANEASGSALAENEKYLDSVQGRIDLFNNALQTMWNNELNSDAIKWFVELGRVLIGVIDKVGLLPTAFIAVSVAIMKMNKMNLVEYFGSISDSILKFGTRIKGFATGIISALHPATTAMNGIKVSSLTSALAVAKVDDANKKAILSQMGLTNAAKTHIIAQDQLTASTISTMVAQGKLTQAQADTVMYLLGIQTATNEVNAARMNEILLSQGLDKTQRKQIITTLGLKGSTQALTREQVLQALATTTLDKEQQAAILSMLGLDVATKGLAGSFAALWASMWPILVVMAGIAALYGIVKLFDSIHVSAEEASETLKETKNNISGLKSELESLQTQLDETREKIGELTALPSLSLTQQEDLERLEREVELLEKQIALKERQLAIEEKQLISDAETAIEKKWTKSGAYDLTNDGAIQEDRWFTWGESGKDVVDKSITKYEELKKQNDSLLDLLNSDTMSYTDLVSAYEDIYGYGSARGSKDVPAKTSEDIRQELQDEYDANEEQMTEIASSIEGFFNDPDYAGLSYGMSDEIDAFLDEYNNAQLKWEKALYGSNSNASAIQSLFGTNATEEMKALKGEIDEIMAGDGDWDSKNTAIMGHLNAIDETAKGYEQLKFVMDELDIERQDIADYFTIQKGEFDSSTIEGITAQYQKGIEVMKQFKAQEEDFVESRMRTLQEGGSVDLFNRPQIDASKLAEAGWEDVGDGTATVFTNTFSKKDWDESLPDEKNIAMNFTPILPDGSVLSPSKLEDYAYGVINGIHEDNLKLKIGATFEGEDAIQQASEVSEEIHNLQESYYMGDDVIKIEGIEYDWDELFSENDAGEFEARADKFGEILKDMDNETREIFMNLAESVANGQMSWDQAIEKFSLHSMQAVIKNMKTEMENLNKLVFKGLDDEISGIIDTFDEFSAALENVADSMDLLHTAQTQMNNSGQISVKTALELIASTDQWNQVLAIENGQIKLVDGAEQALIQTKLNAIKSNIELALQEVNTSLAMLDAGDAAITLSDKLGNWLMQQIERVKEGLAWLDGAAGALWDNLFHGGTNDVVSAGNAAAAKVAKSRANEISDLQRQKANLEAQKAMLEGIDTVDEFKNNYDYDKTPGDKYDDDGKNDRLEKLKEKYERKISNLDNQQTYLENEIERLEAENKGVSKSYYEEQIKLEEKKMALLQQERTELTSLLNSTAEGTDDWWEVADALWEVEHSIQESTLRTIEFRESIADLYKTAFEDLDKAHGDKDDLYSDRQAYIEKYMELLELQGKAKPASGYMGLIAEEEAKLANSMAELTDLRKVLADGMASGEIKKGDERWIEMQSSIRETEAAILDSKVAIEQYKEELKNLQVEAFDMVREAFSNRNDYYTNQQDYIEGYIDYLEATGVDATPEMYEKLIEIEKEKRANSVADLADARAGLAKIEAAGYTAADEEWADANNRIVELEKGIQDSDIAMAEWQKTIREMDFEKFDYFAERVANLNKELDNVYKLVEDEDVAFDDGTWTKEGITALSMLYHQIENNNKMIDEYNEELAKLEQQYKSGEISEKEYTERAEELKDNQWDLIHTNEDLKDTIIDINEARIDMIEEGLNEEIDAYSELIELKKEELDAERDLFEFRKNVEKQTKEISELERKISALSGSDDDADIAERRKLQAQLREAKDGLSDTYYSHSKDSQSSALDDELDAYKKSAEDYVETLREQLENTEAMISQTFSDVLLNADITHQNLIELSNIYGPTLSANLMNPWQQMANQATMTKTHIGDQLILLNEDNIAQFSLQAEPLLKQPFEQGGIAAEAFQITTSAQIDTIQTQVYTASSKMLADLSLPWNSVTSADGPINTFSNTVNVKLTDAVIKAQTDARTMTTSLEEPWRKGTIAVNTWSDNVESALEKTVQDYKKAAAEISQSKAVMNDTPSYTTTAQPTSGSGSGSGNTDRSHGGGGRSIDPPSESVTALQYVLNGLFSSGLTMDGKWGSKTETALKAAQRTMNRAISTVNMDGKYTSATQKGLATWIDNKIRALRSSGSGSSAIGQGIQRYNTIKQKIPAAFHAKGTLGTKQDEWAYTDEPWLGDEIVLIPGANGNLQYMRKGTAVMPADISANLVEWGKINPDMTALANGIQGVNLMSNYVSKPEIKLNIDNFLRCDNVSQDTLPELKKFVNEQMNSLVKQLNYGLKRSGA